MNGPDPKATPSPEQIIRTLGLTVHPREGGFFTETYRSRSVLRVSQPGRPEGGTRSLSTAIYYLLTPDRFSAIHRLRGDEVYHFYSGDPVEMLVLADEGGEIRLLGNDLERGMRPQIVVPGGAWQGARLVAGGRFALLGTTMAPGFDYADYEDGDRADLVRRFPEFSSWIRALTA